MAKKLLGNRKVGDVEYTQGQVISDEEATNAGFDSNDVADTDEAETATGGEAEVENADKDADMDSANGGNTTGDAGKADAQNGGGSGDADADAAAEAARIAAMIGKGEIPDGMVAVPLTEEMYEANKAIYDEHGVKVGDTVYVTPPQE